MELMRKKTPVKISQLLSYFLKNNKNNRIQNRQISKCSLYTLGLVLGVAINTAFTSIPFKLSIHSTFVNHQIIIDRIYSHDSSDNPLNTVSY